MAAKENPFMLTFGKKPTRLIARYEVMEKITSSFQAENPITQTYLVEGLRGSGKTVMMTTISRKLEEDGWIVINLNPAMNLLEEFALRLSKACSRIPNLLKKGFNISAFGYGVGINGEESRQDPVGLIEDCMEVLMKKKKRVLITIDEVQPDQNMRIFASQFQIFIRQDYPLFLLMTGLYEQIHAVQNDPSLTFLLRCPKETMSPLSTFQIKNQYKEIFSTNDETAMELAALTKGYAFAFQALGTVYWDNRDRLKMDEILLKLDEMLDDFVYRKIWESLSSRERDIIAAMEEDDTKVKDVCDKAKMTSGSFSKYREKLIDKGLLLAPKYGYVSLVLPRLSVIAKSYLEMK